MSTEELQLVLTMVQQAGEGAFAVACIYMAVSLAKALIAPFVWLVFFLLVYRGGRYYFDQYNIVNPTTEVDAAKARIITQLEWAKLRYPNLTEESVGQFVKGKVDEIDAD